jgi:hypothetical protein
MSAFFGQGKGDKLRRAPWSTPSLGTIRSTIRLRQRQRRLRSLLRLDRTAHRPKDLPAASWQPERVTDRPYGSVGCWWSLREGGEANVQHEAA